MAKAEKDFDSETTGLEMNAADGGEASVAICSVKPKVHFNLWQTLGMNFSITATPVTVGVYTALTIGLGGFPFYIWALVVASFFQLITCLAIAELASAIPHSSGTWCLPIYPLSLVQSADSMAAEYADWCL